MPYKFAACSLSILVLAGFAGEAVAAPELMMSVRSVGSEWTVQDVADFSDVTQLPDGSWNLVGSWTPGSGAWNCSWNLRVDADPFIFATIGFTNALGTTEDFEVSLTLPTFPPLDAPTLMTGSVSGSVSDSSGDGSGATMSNNLLGDPFYTALIDGAGVRTLLDSPFSFSAPAGVTDPWDGGDFIGEVAGAVTTTIGLDHKFRLTSLDSISFTSTFSVVPEPTTVMYFGVIALLAGARRRP